MSTQEQNTPTIHIVFDSDFVGIETQSDGTVVAVFDDEVHEIEIPIGKYYVNKFKNIRHGTRFQFTMTEHGV